MRRSLFLVQDLDEEVILAVKTQLHTAIQAAPDWAKAWHSWALFNVHAMEHYSRGDVETAKKHVAPAVTAFFKSVALGQASGGAGSKTGYPQSSLCWF
jgi:FKBP12-rapamycin complex-associated protein